MCFQALQRTLVHSEEAGESAKGRRWKGFCCVLRNETSELKCSEQRRVVLDEVGEVYRGQFTECLINQIKHGGFEFCSENSIEGVSAD